MSTSSFDWVDKIAKLLALAAGAGTEAEAEAASAKAQSLMAERNLTMAQVEMTGGNRNKVNRTKDTLKRGASYKYQQELWATLCQVNFCFHFIVPVYKSVQTPDRKFGGYTTQQRIVGKQHQILGREENVAAVKIMGEYLEQAIERLVPVPNTQRLSKWALSWKAGCADRLQDRIRADQRRREEESKTKAAGQSGAWGLTLRNVADIEYEANMEFQYPGWIDRKRLREQQDREYALALKNQPRDVYIPGTINCDPPKKETESQRAKREAAEERARERRRNANRREYEKTDWDAYHSGGRAAESISLHRQVDKTNTKEIA